MKPLVPGHVLVVPLRRECISVSDLTPEENKDFFATVQVINRFISHEFEADSINIAIQDGPEAGQTVPHLHTHIIPRYKLNNIGDKIYEELANWTFEQQLSNWNQRRTAYIEGSALSLNNELAKPDVERHPRSNEDMYREAQDLKEKLEAFLAVNSTLNNYYT